MTPPNIQWIPPTSQHQTVWKHYCTRRQEWWSTWLDQCDKCEAKKPLFPQIPGVDYPETK